MKVLVIIFICVVVIICSGYFVHICNSKYAPTWGDGIARVLAMIFEIMLSVPYCIIKVLPLVLSAMFKFVKWLVTEAKKSSTNEDVLEMLSDPARMLTDEEILELVKSFDMHPYDTPTLSNYDPGTNGVSWYNIEAIKLTDTYSNLTHAQLSKMCYHKIENYIMETRGIKVPVYIKVATPTQLYFVIPLSKHVEKLLSKQSQENTPVPKTNNSPILEETVIDIFNDSDGDKK